MKANLARFFDHSNELLCVANTDGYFVEVNPKWEEVTGYTTQELLSRPFVEFVHPEDLEKTLAEAAGLANGKETVEFTNRYVTKEGKHIWLQWNATIRENFIYAVATNITDLKEQSYFFDKMQEAAAIGYWKLDLSTMTPFWSEKTYDIHGVPRGTPVDLENAINFYAPEARPTVEGLVGKSIEDGTPWDVELPFVNAQGLEMWVRTIGRARQENGKTVELHGVFQDVTERKMTDLLLEQSLTESDKYKKALDSQAIVAVTDIKGTITYVNEKFCEISGYSQYELLGENHRLLSSGHHPKSFFKQMWETILSGNQWKGRVKNKTKSGGFYWVDTTITPIENRAGKIKEFIAIRLDVTKQVLLEEQLKEQQANLVKSARMASLGEMAGGVAHEINNPLAIISTAATIMKSMLSGDSIDTSLIRPNLETIENTVTRISKIVDGLRSFSREDRHDDDLKKELVSYEKVINDTLTFCSEKFRSRGVDLKVDVNNSVMINANSTQISQILLNLLNNAFYAVQGEKEKIIEVSVSQNEKSTILKVSDSGPGISEEIREKVFQPFFTTKPVGSGTGLGLGISYGIASRHGGKLYLSDERSKTTFILELPKVSERSEKVAA